jgi:4-hydroxybenzoate polyprenyltransferase
VAHLTSGSFEALPVVLPAGMTRAAACSWLRLLKFQYHASFLSVVFGAALFARGLPGPLVGSLALLYLSFNVLLYGGIYTLNDVADLDSDRHHPVKCHRPLASGAIAPAHAVTFAVVVIGLGLVTALATFGPGVAGTFIIFLALNACYSLWARNVRYVDIVFNASTHPLRFMLGATLAGSLVPAGHLVSYWAMAIGLSSLRRSIEVDLPGAAARRTLASFHEPAMVALRGVALVVMVTTALVAGPEAPGFHLTVLSVYVTLAFVAPSLPSSRAFLRRLWTK